MNILIIDDDKMITDLTKSLVKHSFCECNTYIDLTGDLNNIDLSTIDIVLCDINLGWKDGRVLIKKIKTKHPNIYSILMSGALLNDDFKQMKKYKVDAILPKPFTQERLEDALKKAL